MVRALSVCRGFDAHLVLVTRTVSGETDSPITYHKRRRCYWDEDDEGEDEDEGGHTIGEVRVGSWVVAMRTGIDWPWRTNKAAKLVSSPLDRPRIAW